MDQDTADKISTAWARASLPDDGTFLVRPAIDQFAGDLVRLVPPEPEADGWAIVQPSWLGAAASTDYEWTRAAAILDDRTVHLVVGAISSKSKRVAVATYRFEAVSVLRVLHIIDSDDRHSAKWSFSAGDLALLVDESLDHQGRPVSSDRTGAFARKLARSAGWDLDPDC